MKIYKYKKIFSIFLLTSLLLLIVPITTLNTNASSKIDFSLFCDSVYKNRLFNVDLIVNGNANLSAFSVSITYDSESVEFRKVDSPDKAFDVKKKNSNGKVNAIVLCSYGYRFNGKAKIISFKFKSVDTGITDFGLAISDPVDNNGNKLSIGSVYGAEMKIEKNKITSKRIKSNSSKSSGRSNSTSIKTYGSNNSVNGKADSVKVPKVNYVGGDSKESASTTSPMDNAYTDNSEPKSLFVMGVLVTLGVVLIIYIVYNVGRAGKENKDTKTEKDNNQEEK